MFCKGFRLLDGKLEATYTAIYIGKTRNEQLSSREYMWLEKDMEFVPDIKKGGGGLRYLRELNDYNDTSAKSQYFQASGFNKTSGEV